MSDATQKQDGIQPEDIKDAQRWIRFGGLIVGAVAFLWMQLSPAPEGLSADGWNVAAIAALMGIWWMTEALPLSVTALIPLVALPLLGVGEVKAATSGYAAKAVLLILGGFILGLALQRWRLHERIAMLIIKFIGSNTTRVVAGFMVACAFLSMWISNTASTVVMLPIAISIIALVRQENAGNPEGADRFATSLMLALAYSATIGGMMTLVGTPTNLVFKGYMESSFGFSISFLDWMKIGVPIGLVLLGLCWWMLVFLLFPSRIGYQDGVDAIVTSKLRELGRITPAETRVLAIFGMTIGLWLTGDYINGLGLPIRLNDMSVAMLGAILMFVIPAQGYKGKALLRWEDTKDLPWGVLLLMGGAISLAGFLNSTGVAAWMGSYLVSDEPMNMIWVILITTTMITFISGLMSNTATLTAFLPVIVVLMLDIGENPLMAAIPATLAASCAFMFPVGTPPNAIVFGSNMITIPQMAKAGFYLNIVAIVLISLLSYLMMPWLFDVQQGVTPDWAVQTQALGVKN